MSGFGLASFCMCGTGCEGPRFGPGRSPPAGLSLDGFSALGLGLVPQDEALLFMPPPVRSATWACRAVWVLAGATHGSRTAQSRLVRSEWTRARPDVHGPPPFAQRAYGANVSIPAETLPSRVRSCCPGSP